MFHFISLASLSRAGWLVSRMSSRILSHNCWVVVVEFSLLTGSGALSVVWSTEFVCGKFTCVNIKVKIYLHRLRYSLTFLVLGPFFASSP